MMIKIMMKIMNYNYQLQVSTKVCFLSSPTTLLPSQVSPSSVSLSSPPSSLGESIKSIRGTVVINHHQIIIIMSSFTLIITVIISWREYTRNCCYVKSFTLIRVILARVCKELLLCVFRHQQLRWCQVARRGRARSDDDDGNDGWIVVFAKLSLKLPMAE